MKKFFIVLMIIFVGTMPVAFGQVLIQNDQQYIGDDGALHVVGEIKNNLDAPLHQIVVHVELFDENQNLVITQDVNSLVNTVMPEMTSPFDLVLTNNHIKNIESYSLELDYKISPPKNQVIDIMESKLTRDNHNNLMITGIVTNKGDITANTIAIIATLYDKKGNVAAVSRVHPEPDYLRAKDNAFFLITIPDKIQTLGIDDFTLIAESEEYAAVPEFPVGTLVLLTGTLSAYIGITRSSRIITGLISATNPK